MRFRPPVKRLVFSAVLLLIFFSPPFELGEFEWRTVDIYVYDLVMILFSIMIVPRLLWMIKLRDYAISYIVFLLFVTLVELVRMLWGQSSSVGWLFNLKYTELFVVYLFGYYLSSDVSQAHVEGTVRLAGLAAIPMFLYQVSSGEGWGYYYAGLVGAKGPSHEGFLLCMLTVLCVLASSHLRGWKMVGNAALCFGLALYTAATLSRISLLALMLFLLFYMRASRKAICTLVALFFLVILVYRNVDLGETPLQRLRQDYFLDPSGRIEKWQDHIDLMDFQSWIIGKGSAFKGEFGGAEITGAGVDNLFMRLVWDFGVIGLMAFVVMLVLLARRGLMSEQVVYRRYYLAVFFIMLIHNITHELFFILKTADLFWFLIGFYEYKLSEPVPQTSSVAMLGVTEGARPNVYEHTMGRTPVNNL